jgi:hypothetical protein
MLTSFVVLVASVAMFVALLLVIVVIGIRQEPPTEELSEQASNLVAAFVRRLLGLHVRKPDSLSNHHQNDRCCLARVITPATPTEKSDSK